MIIPELVNYISSERQKGTSDYIIKMNFVAQGWSEADFAEAASKLPPPVRTKSDAAALVPQLDKQPEWQAAASPQGVPVTSSSKAMPPSRSLFKLMAVLVIAGASFGAIFYYQDVVGSFVSGTYAQAQPYVSDTVQGMAASISGLFH